MIYLLDKVTHSLNNCSLRNAAGITIPFSRALFPKKILENTLETLEEFPDTNNHHLLVSKKENLRWCHDVINIFCHFHSIYVCWIITKSTWLLTTVKVGTPGTDIGGLVGNAGGGTVQKSNTNGHSQQMQNKLVTKSTI